VYGTGAARRDSGQGLSAGGGCRSESGGALDGDLEHDHISGRQPGPQVALLLGTRADKRRQLADEAFTSRGVRRVAEGTRWPRHPPRLPWRLSAAARLALPDTVEPFTLLL
jgi:hypothetical protein